MVPARTRAHQDEGERRVNGAWRLAHRRACVRLHLWRGARPDACMRSWPSTPVSSRASSAWRSSRRCVRGSPIVENGADVDRLIDEALDELTPASVSTYLPILVERRVRDRIEHRPGRSV